MENRIAISGLASEGVDSKIIFNCVLFFTFVLDKVAGSCVPFISLFICLKSSPSQKDFQLVTFLARRNSFKTSEATTFRSANTE